MTLGERFENPERRFYPTPVWWWSGEPLEAERLRWQMERLASGGAKNLLIMNLLPTAPDIGKSRDEPVMFSEEWWEIFEAVCGDAEELGVSLWLYDQIGHGGANLLGEAAAGNPGATGLVLERVVVEVEGAGAVECPPAGTAVGAAFVADDGTVVPLEPAAGGVAYEGRGRLMLFHTVPRGFNFMAPTAAADLIRIAFEPYEERVPDLLGTVIVGSFQDELPPTQSWSPDFAERFREIAGYDLLPRLADLWEEISPDSPRVRRDFHHVRGKLAEEAFFRPLHEWHEHHGMLSAFDQEYGAREGNPVHSNRLYGDYLRTHRWFSVPGSDHHGDAKIHSSLAHAYGHERVWIESFHSSGWGGTVEETFDWLLPWIGAGANLYDPHATYYSTRNGWWDWAPPATDWRQPYWRHYPHFARAVARLCSVLTWGTHDCDVAVLYPAATAQAALTPDAHSVLSPDGVTDWGKEAIETYQRLNGTMTWFEVEPGALNDLCRDFDVLDDDTVAAAGVAGGQLEHHGERYSTVILPACAVLEEPTARRLVEFVDGGGALIAIGPLPEITAGLGEDGAAVAALRERFERGAAKRVETVEELAGAFDAIPTAVHADVPTLCRRAGETVVLFVPATFPRASRVSVPEEPDPVFDWLDVEIDFDPSRWAGEREIVVSGVSGDPQLWEPFSGRRRRLRAEPTEDGVRVRVPFDDGPAALLVWGAEGEAEEEPAEAVLGEPVRLDGPWEAEVEPSLEDEWGDLAAPPADLPVEAWTLEHEDDGEWVPAQATFGARAKWLGPAAPEELPAPGEEPRGGAWQEAVWSPSRGIRKDPIHRQTLGTSGRVPEEFLRFGHLDAGQAVQVRTTIHAGSAVETHLLLGAAAVKEAWLDGAPLPLTEDGYLAHTPVALPAGTSVLDLRLEAEEPIFLRAYFAFVAELEGSLRPDWIRVAGPSRASSVVAFSRELELAADAREARALVGASGPCRVMVDGTEIGRHSGYTAETEGVRDEFAHYDLAAHLSAGRHRLRVEVDDFGRTTPSAQIDLVVSSAGEELRLHSGADWEGERDGVAAPLEIRRAPAGMIVVLSGEYLQTGDPAASHLWQRPHPLPAAVWLEPGRPGADPGTAVDARLDGASGPQRFRLTAPPGAERLQVSPAPGCRLVELELGGERVAVAGDPGETLLLDLPAGDPGPRALELVFEPAPGLRGGSVLAGPLRFGTGTGSIALGDWAEQGLPSYSGGVRYRRRLDAARPGRMRLDLGLVRGTAELLVDGESAGVRVCSPYEFEFEAKEDSLLEVIVMNTLGPHFDAISPGPHVFGGQTRSGIFGPVTLAGPAGAGERA